MSIADDFRFALRMLAKRPWITAMMVLALGVGIGVNATVFTLVNAILIRGLPFPEGDRIVYIQNQNLSRNEPELRSSYLDLLDWRAQARELEEIAAFISTAYNVADDASAPARIDGASVTANAFPLLRVDPILGRHFLPEEDQPGARVVIIGHSVWQDRYGGDAGVLGRTIRLDGEPFQIVGVMPAEFRFPDQCDIWTPIQATRTRERRDRRVLGVFARLADGAQIASAQTEMSVIAERLEEQHPETNQGVGARVITFNESFNGGDVRTTFVAMLAAVGLVLLIACANVANVQLTRAAERQREISIRAALGAGRWRIARQLLIESVTLSCAGGLLGLAIAVVGVHLFDLASRDARPFFVQFTFDAAVFGYLAAVCLLAGVLFGLAPVVHALRSDINRSLKDGSRGQTSGGGSRRFAGLMVVAEVALSVVLLVGAGLMVRSFSNLMRFDIGVEAENVLTGYVSLPRTTYPEEESRRAFQRELLTQVRALPGVAAATASSHLPGRGTSGRRIEIEGRPPADPDQAPLEGFVTVDTDFFTTLGTAVVQGRSFDERDVFDATPVAVINQAFAAKYWPREDPISRRIRVLDSEGATWVTVIGVSPNIRQDSIGQSGIRPLVYRPYAQEPGFSRFLLVHTETAADSIAPALRGIVSRLDPNLPIEDLSTFAKRLDDYRWGYSVSGGIFSAFGGIALILAALGVFALVADAVRRRTSEFGIRMALGAQPEQILRLVLGYALRRVAVGMVLGLPLAYGFGKILSTMLVSVSPSDITTLTGVCVFLLSITLLASWLPARRINRIDPGKALRNE